MASCIPDHLLTAENKAQVEKLLREVAPTQPKDAISYASETLDNMAVCPRCQGLGIVKEVCLLC